MRLGIEAFSLRPAGSVAATRTTPARSAAGMGCAPIATAMDVRTAPPATSGKTAVVQDRPCGGGSVDSTTSAPITANIARPDDRDSQPRYSQDC